MLLLLFNLFIGYIILSCNKVTSVINNINIQKKDNNLLVTYDVINTLDTETELPKIRVRLLDNKDYFVNKHIANMNYKLEPKEVVRIKTIFTKIPKNTCKLDLTVGHYLHFVLFQ